MDYNYSDKETVRLDFKTEQDLSYIKSTLKQLMSSLEDLSIKVEKIAGAEYPERETE